MRQSDRPVPGSGTLWTSAHAEIMLIPALRKFLFCLLLLVPSPLPAHKTGIAHEEPSAKQLRELGLEEFITASTPGASSAALRDELWSTWAFDPYLLLGLGLCGGLYVLGIARLWRATHVGGGISVNEAGWYALGWLSLVVALVSPLHPWGEVLFSAHMVQHEILMLIAAPLLVLGRPLLAFMWALPVRVRRPLVKAVSRSWWRSVWELITGAFVAWLIHAILLWAWHIPSWFEATLTSDLVHSLQHISFLGSALLFWWAVIYGRQRSVGYGMAVLYMFTTAVHSGALGALLTFTSRLWYPAYAATAPQLGLTPLEDQQLGGLIMWVPAGLIYIASGLALFAGWLRESERRASIAPVISFPMITAEAAALDRSTGTQ